MNAYIRILLVEDDKIDVLSFQRFLKIFEISAHLTIANSFEKAQILLKSNEYDIVFLDDNLYGERLGLNLLQFVKSAVTIILTASKDQETVLEAWRKGAFSFYDKNLKKDGEYSQDFKSLINEALQHKLAEDLQGERVKRRRDDDILPRPGLIYFTSDGEIGSADRKMLSMLGYEKEDDLLDKPITEIFFFKPEEVSFIEEEKGKIIFLKAKLLSDLFKDFNEKSSKGLRRSIEVSSVYQDIKLFLKKKDGTPLQVIFSAKILQHNGISAGIFCDIYDYKKYCVAKNSVILANTGARMLLLDIPTSMIFLDSSFKILECNTHFRKELNFNWEMLGDQNVIDVLDNDQNILENALQNLNQEKSIIKINGFQPRGQNKIFDVSIRPLLDLVDQIENIVITLIDVTERTEREAILTESIQAYDNKFRNEQALLAILNELLQIGLQPMSLKEQLQAALNLIATAKFLGIEPQGCILFPEVSKNGEEQLRIFVHYKMDEFLKNICEVVPFGYCLCGKSAEKLEPIFKNQLDDDHDEFYEGMPNHGHYIIPIIGRDHKLLGILNLYVKKDHEENKDEKAFLLSIADILALIIENGLKTEDQERLVQESIAKRDDALAKVIDSDRLATVGRSLAGLAHEINQPAQGLLTFIELALERIEKGTMDTEWLKKKLLERLNQAQLINSIIANTRNLSREHVFQKNPISLNDVLENTLIVINKNILNARIQIIKDISEGFKILADYHSLQQVFINLLSNAIDACSETASKDNLEIRITASSEEDIVIITFEDTGKGMTTEVLAKIYEPFFTTKIGRGTGLGIPISLDIIKKHGGTFICTSQVNKGTKFTITLPK